MPLKSTVGVKQSLATAKPAKKKKLTKAQVVAPERAQPLDKAVAQTNGPPFPDSTNELRHSHVADYHLALLEAEVARADLLVRKQARLWQIAKQDPNDPLRGLRVTDDDAAKIAQIPIGGHWGQVAKMSAEEEALWQEAHVEAQAMAEQLAQQAQEEGVLPRLLHLAISFRLSQFEYDLFLLVLLPSIDLRYQKLYGYLQDDVRLKQPRVNLVLDLLCNSGLERLYFLESLNQDAPLIKYGLIQPLSQNEKSSATFLDQTLTPTPSIAAWLLGNYQPPAELATSLNFQHPSNYIVSERYVTDGIVAAQAWASLSHAIHEQPILCFFGPDQENRVAISRLIATSVDQPMLTIDLEMSKTAGILPLNALRLTLRDARLTNALAHITSWEACFENDDVPADILKEIYEHPELVILSSKNRWHPSNVARSDRMLWLEFPNPNFEQRQSLWRHFLAMAEGLPADAPSNSIDVEEIASQFTLNSGQIRDAIASAWDMAIQRGDRRPVKADLFAAARAHSSTKLSELARKVEPRYEWGDLILPDDQLEILKEIVEMVRSRPKVLETWGLGQKLASSAAVTVLFAGPPGTGKTMAAEVIAGQLGLDLYKIDLSTMVSKYIGDTEKNLDKIFNEAQSSNAILFFDEADAIFGKRSQVKDARDRYANIEVSYLLQRMETYDGVTILATNLRANLDEAFLRRLQFAIDVPFPDEQDRLRIWQTLMPTDLEVDPALDLEEMAKRFKFAGGNIRNIIVTAAYRAASDGGVVTMEHLMHGTKRELQKMGRLVSDQQMKIK